MQKVDGRSIRIGINVAEMRPLDRQKQKSGEKQISPKRARAPVDIFRFSHFHDTYLLCVSIGHSLRSLEDRRTIPLDDLATACR